MTKLKAFADNDFKIVKMTISLFNSIENTVRKGAFENIVGKGENAGNQHFLLFQLCFLSFSKQIPIFGLIFFWLSAKLMPTVLTCLNFFFVKS